MNDQKSAWDHAVTIAFEAGHDLRKQLPLNEANFRFRAPYSHKNPRHVFIYQAIDEAQKAATCLMRWKDFYSDNSSEINSQESETTKKQIRRITQQAVLEEQSLRSRKLTEILADTILFLNTNEDVYFKDYFYFHELVEYQNVQKDRNEFFCFKNRNLEHHIEWLKKQILELEKNGLKIGQRWYLHYPKSITYLKKIDLSSFRSKYKKISSEQNAEIVTLLGRSYLHVYGESRRIHFSANDTSEGFNENGSLLTAKKIAILLINLLLKAQELSLVSSAKMTKLLSGIKANDVASEPYRVLTRSQASIGDYVLVGRELVQVMEERESKYGYFSYHVRYVGKPPLEEVSDDWFASFQIRRIGSKTEILNKVKSVISKHVDIDEDKIASIDDGEFEQCLSQSIDEVLKAMS